MVLTTLHRGDGDTAGSTTPVVVVDVPAGQVERLVRAAQDDQGDAERLAAPGVAREELPRRRGRVLDQPSGYTSEPLTWVDLSRGTPRVTRVRHGAELAHVSATVRARASRLSWGAEGFAVR